MMNRDTIRRGKSLFLAYMTYNMRKVPRPIREKSSWLYLFAWAEAGGQPEDARLIRA